MRVTLVGLLLLASTAATSAQPVAIVDVTVIPMNRETTLAHQTVVVQGESILSVGSTGNTPVPDDAVIIDGSGRYLVPGLTDAHVHLAGTIFGRGREEFGDAPLYLAYGVTTVFNLGGTAEHLDWRRRVIAGDLLAPTIYTSPPFFNEPYVTSPEEVEREISASVTAGYDLLKFREIVGRARGPTTVGLSVMAYRRMNDAARRAGLPLVGHAPVNLGLDAMLDARQQSLAHVGELTRIHFNPVMRHRWSLLAGGIGLLIVLVVVFTPVLMRVMRRHRRVHPAQARVLWPAIALGTAGLMAAACYVAFSPGGPLFDSNGLRAIFTAAGLVIIGATIVLAWLRSLVVIPAVAMTYWMLVWTPIAWRTSQVGIDQVAGRLKDAGTMVQSHGVPARWSITTTRSAQADARRLPATPPSTTCSRQPVIAGVGFPRMSPVFRRSTGIQNSRARSRQPCTALV